MDVGRISAGKIESRHEPVELREVLARSVETVRAAIDQHAHTLVMNEDEARLVIRGDLDRLTQVFSNLISNAAKYTERGGRIEIRVQREGNEAVISISDNGIGIPQEAIAGLFQCLHRFVCTRVVPKAAWESGSHSSAGWSSCIRAA